MNTDNKMSIEDLKNFCYFLSKSKLWTQKKYNQHNMLKFDPITLTDWKNRTVRSLSIEFVASGCEGTSIAMHENTILPSYIPMCDGNPDLMIYIAP